MPGIGERILYPVAKRWIAGYELEDAIKAAQNANNRKIRAIVNRLGEHTPDVNRIEEYTQEYLRIAERLQKENVNGTISVKPSQLGLAAEASLYKRNLVRILEDAEARGLDVWVDMENSPYTERTLQVYRELFEDHPQMGVCLQADMKEKLAAQGYHVGEYIPYGPEWYNYSKRRMRERKRNILLLARSLFS